MGIGRLRAAISCQLIADSFAGEKQMYSHSALVRWLAW